MDGINLSESFTSSKIGVKALPVHISGSKSTVELGVLWGLLERQNKQSQDKQQQISVPCYAGLC